MKKKEKCKHTFVKRKATEGDPGYLCTKCGTFELTKPTPPQSSRVNRLKEKWEVSFNKKFGVEFDKNRKQRPYFNADKWQFRNKGTTITYEIKQFIQTVSQESYERGLREAAEIVWEHTYKAKKQTSRRKK